MVKPIEEDYKSTFENKQERLKHLKEKVDEFKKDFEDPETSSADLLAIFIKQGALTALSEGISDEAEF